MDTNCLKMDSNRKKLKRKTVESMEEDTSEVGGYKMISTTKNENSHLFCKICYFSWFYIVN